MALQEARKRGVACEQLCLPTGTLPVIIDHVGYARLGEFVVMAEILTGC